MKTETPSKESWWDKTWNTMLIPLRSLATRPWSCFFLLVVPVALCLISLSLAQWSHKDEMRGTATMQTATGAAVQTSTGAAMQTSTALGTPPVTSTPSIEPTLDLTLTAAQ